MNPRASCLSALLYSLLCAGCVVSTDYPADWPKQMVTDEHDGCPDISGTYQEPGIWASEGSNFSLAEYLLGLEAAPDSFSISHESKDTIVITTFASEEVSESRAVYSRSSGDYTCDLGRLWISKTTLLDPDGGIGVIIARVKEKFGFSRTEDGSLLAEHHGGGAGVMLVFGIVPIPSAATGNDYALWRPINSDGKPD